MATLITADFESGSNGDTITAGNTGASTVVGTVAGIITISTTDPFAGTRCLRVVGATAFGYANWTLASHNDHYALVFFTLDGTPGGTAQHIEVRNGADSAFAYRIGVDTSNKLTIFNATTLVDTATAALTVGQRYALEIHADGAANLSLDYYSLAAPGTLIETLTGALTATNFSKTRLGNAAAVAGAGFSYHADRFVVSDSAMPGWVAGTSVVTLGAMTSAGAGTVTVTGSSTVTLGAVTSAGTGTATVTGTSAVTLGAMTSAGAGSVDSGVTGTSVVTLAAMTSTGDGFVIVHGTSAVTLGAMTSAGVGTVGVTPTGTSAVTLAPMTSAGVGTVTVIGTSAVTLAAMTSAGTGTATVTGTSVVTLGAMTSAGTGTLTVTGTSAVTLGAMTSAATGTVNDNVTGTSAVTLAPMTSTGVGTVTVIGTSTVTLGAVTSSATGTVTVTGTSIVTLGAVTSTAAGTVTVIGTSAVTLAPMTSVGVGYVTVPAAPNPDRIDIDTRAAVHISTSARVDVVTCGDRVHIYDVADLHVTTRGAP